MEKITTSWYSSRVNKDMPVAVYGHYGFVLLLVPTAAADFLEYERFGLIDAISPFIEGGKLKVYSVNSINNDSWLNNNVHPKHKTWIHNQFNYYIYDEVIPYIKATSGHDTPIIISGASFGALHSMNLFLKRPDLLNGVIAMSGVYDLTEYTKGHYDDDVYFNSPQHYMPNLTDHHVLEQIRRSQHIHLFSGSGPYEEPNAARSFASILYSKGINYELDIWGSEWPHDWNTWKAMLPHYLETRF
ncbi:MAG TPA: alpha/beta hydrolase-fold protein [Flavisolibacter sp.]|jgi:esterase/lipase superfamily enzyme|nr:alpha/beta hydrolase-fold protein [Flavisolibacter sp.]